MKLGTADKLVDLYILENWLHDHATNLKLIIHLETDWDNHWTEGEEPAVQEIFGGYIYFCESYCSQYSSMTSLYFHGN